MGLSESVNDLRRRRAIGLLFVWGVLGYALIWPIHPATSEQADSLGEAVTDTSDDTNE